ncbi:MAG: mechanosensitive ion channel [Armatimonadota bacterium]|nr:mechanosensitive ion channel [Armatimonadota bacterium]MDR7449576.1 mechanosensitive ion channel [Armatimonadota bacterium]MDR7460206.1 mechanosensitive ion channel [Armatimonadota bacterium]MDR7480293.1 mechanosensitive ion channel [Armatimonadota bacterium]MDR7503043.1 mechanosensitive ion channel [Armatimonadota bacterium]
MLLAVGVVVAGAVAWRLLHAPLARAMERSRVDPALRDLLLAVGKYVVLGVALITAASQLGLHVGALLGGLGVAGLAVGLAARDTIGNLISGLIILWDHPFELGDLVVIDGVEGRVVRIGLRSTHLRTADGELVIIPNSKVSEARITNRTAERAYRIRVALSLPAGQDTPALREALARAAADDAEVLADPPPQVLIMQALPDTVTLEVGVWVQPRLPADVVRSRLYDRLGQVLRERGGG